jgi:hypothetical protein
MIARLAAFVVPYQQTLETEAAQRNLHLSLQGLLSHLPSKNAEDIATFIDVQRQVIQEFIGTAPWEHRPQYCSAQILLVEQRGYEYTGGA